MFRSLPSLFLLCVALATLVRGGDWSKTCSSPKMIFGNLAAHCRSYPAGLPSVCTILDLRQCYGFDTTNGLYQKDGYAFALLVAGTCEWRTNWLYSGDFGATCEGCQLDNDGHTMWCKCPDGGGKKKWYYVDTDDLIRNDDGWLRCYNHEGYSCDYDKLATLSDSGETKAVHSLAFTA
ncbi:hypothetical protein PG985_002939 [Apiospora marii]|uniref:Cyanovirin-N domain-containing protein n=1 Tax=Apiospora marii TaxID=335849 RepID=A0ABR1RVR3_9PEZI